jgi:hypothetical protein
MLFAVSHEKTRKKHHLERFHPGKILKSTRTSKLVIMSGIGQDKCHHSNVSEWLQ